METKLKPRFPEKDIEPMLIFRKDDTFIYNPNINKPIKVSCYKPENWTIKYKNYIRFPLKWFK